MINKKASLFYLDRYILEIEANIKDPNESVISCKYIEALISYYENEVVRLKAELSEL